MNTAPLGTSSQIGIRSLTRAQDGATQALLKLATGRRLTSAAVDPAAIIAVNRMQADLTASLKQIEAMERENSRIATEDGAASVMGEMLVELDGLAVQAANTAGMSDAEREALQIEADSVLQGINHVANITGYASSYSTSSLGSADGLNPGGDTGEHSLSDLAAGGSLNLVDGNIENAQRVIRSAIKSVSTRRGQIGMQVRENESIQRSLGTEAESLSGAISKLADADMAKQTSVLARNQVLGQASIGAILAANSDQHRVLDLLA